MRKANPNVVWVLTDDQGYGDLGCHGNPIIRTPQIDALHAQSARFTDFHVGPTCAPTRAGLLTGHFHNSTGVWHTIGGRSLLRRNEVTLAQVFRDSGYQTGIFGKWHLGDNYPYRPQDRGFAEAVVHGGGGIGQTPDFWGNDYFDDTYSDRGNPRRFEGYCTDVFFRLAAGFIERHKDEPFFCTITTNAPHQPLQVDDQYVAPYLGQVPEHRARFYGMIACIDENVGKLRARLQELGLSENTIFIFMTDNGTADGCDVTHGAEAGGLVTGGYNAGMRGKKGSAYEGGHRVPFFLHWPGGGLTAGRDIPELAANVDFMPTLLDLCGIRQEGLAFDGRSLKPLLGDYAAPWPERTLVTDSQRVPQPVKWKDSAVMRGSWRLINGQALYNIKKDPEQRENLADLYPHQAAALRQDYELWWAKVSRQFDEEIPISIGTEFERTTCINSHDWRGDAGDCAWNQGEIRQGKICNSYVELLVETPGLYVFELRRWPRAENRAIAEGIHGEIRDWFSGGRAIPICRATIRLQGIMEMKPVLPGDKFIEFVLPLQAGPQHLQTFFEDRDGNILGAYFVYIRRK